MNAFLANLYLRAITVRDRQEGQAMAEYGIILALIAVAVHRCYRRCSAARSTARSTFIQNGKFGG